MKRIRLWMPRLLITTGLLIIGLLVLSMFWVSYYTNNEVKRTPQMMFYSFDVKHDSIHLQVEHQWIPLSEISQNMVVAVLAAQDKDFYLHEGFALPDDRDSSKLAKRVLPLTISQKTAEFVFLTKGKSYIKNILRGYFTVLEEYMWDKNRILEIYLNSALIGDGIFGVEVASHIYFNKSVADLTQSESAFIAALMDNPQSIDVLNPHQDILRRQSEILSKMGLMMHIKVGRKPIEEKGTNAPSKPIYKREWRASL